MGYLFNRLKGLFRVVHTDHRRVIQAAAKWGKEITVITVTTNNIRLGDHYHPYWEVFLVAAGYAIFVQEDPVTKERHQQPVSSWDVVVLKPGLAHVFVADAGLVLIGLKTSEKFDAPKYIIKTN